MEDPNLIATLIPTDRGELAKNAFLLEHNRTRSLQPARGIAEGPTISSRDATPALEDTNEADCDPYDSTHRIILTFDEKPIDPTKGFSFGTDARVCDVLLGHRGAHCISNLHFCITFNEGKRIILKDSSTNGTSVSYSGQAKNEVRRHFTWILDLKKDEGEWDIEVHVPNEKGLAFKVVLAKHDTCKAEYDKKLDEFLRKSRTALPPLDTLGIYSHTTTAQPSQLLTPRKYPVYISERKLGGGSFGGVDKVIDVSTGSIYARKQFYEPQWKMNEKRRKQQKEDWLDLIRREMRIMKDNPHEHTVQVIDFREEPSPFLVMPYFPLGNLEALHGDDNESPITIEETIDLLFQALKALAYLHPRGVAHRDLKPENILVESRPPFSIKLADFGFANDKSNLETFCGTRKYAAPEIFSKTKYTTSVDLWSLGVIALQYGYGLPRAVRERRSKHRDEQESGLAWCHRIVDHANDWDSDGLIELLTIGMLRMKPEERLSAGACMKKGYDLHLFDGRPSDLGSATPTRQTASQGEISDDDDDDTATIILDALWGAEEFSGHDNGRTRRCNPQHVSGAPEPRIVQAPNATGNGDGRRSRLGSLGTAFEQRGGNVQAPVDRLSCPLEARSTAPVGYKRQRSPAGGSAGSSAEHTSNMSRIKRQQPDVRLTGIPVSRSYDLPDQHLGQSNQFRTMYDVVRALLTDLRPGHSESRDIDDHTWILVGDLCEHCARLEITEMRLTQNDLSENATITAVSNSREIVLASLTSSELMSSTADLAAYLLRLLQFQNPQLRSTPMAPVDDACLQTDPIARDNHSRNWAVDDKESQMTLTSVRRHGVTYPSSLLDVTNLSGCSIPTFSGS